MFNKKRKILPYIPSTMPVGGNRFLFSYEPIVPSDLRIIKWQMQGHKFDPELILGVTNRCKFGCPRVIMCSPISGFMPFPTSFWLTCPRLVQVASSIEANGGVSKLERWLESYAYHEWILFNIDHQLARIALISPNSMKFLRRFKPQIFNRLRRSGIGGIQYDGKSPPRVKCIHLQIASLLSLLSFRKLRSHYMF